MIQCSESALFVLDISHWGEMYPGLAPLDSSVHVANELNCRYTRCLPFSGDWFLHVTDRPFSNHCHLQWVDDGKRCSAWKYYRKGRGGRGGAKLMTESDEYRFELLAGR